MNAALEMLQRRGCSRLSPRRCARGGGPRPRGRRARGAHPRLPPRARERAGGGAGRRSGTPKRGAGADIPGRAAGNDIQTPRVDLGSGRGDGPARRWGRDGGCGSRGQEEGAARPEGGRTRAPGGCPGGTGRRVERKPEGGAEAAAGWAGGGAGRGSEGRGSGPRALTPLEELGHILVAAQGRVAALGVQTDEHVEQRLHAQGALVAPGPVQEQLLQLLEPHLGRHGAARPAPHAPASRRPLGQSVRASPRGPGGREP